MNYFSFGDAQVRFRFSGGMFDGESGPTSAVVAAPVADAAVSEAEALGGKLVGEGGHSWA